MQQIKKKISKDAPIPDLPHSKRPSYLPRVNIRLEPNLHVAPVYFELRFVELPIQIEIMQKCQYTYKSLIDRVSLRLFQLL